MPMSSMLCVTVKLLRLELGREVGSNELLLPSTDGTRSKRVGLVDPEPA